MESLDRLIFRSGLRRRLRRFVDVLAIAALPALALASVSMLLAKHGAMSPAGLGGAAVTLLVLSIVPALIAALWPVAPLDLLIRLDRANETGDQLSSAYDFMGRPEQERTAPMRLHVERTLRDLGRIKVAPAEPLRLPPEVWPALGLIALLVFVGLLREPDYPDLVPVAYPEPAPEVIIDTGRLLEDARNITALRDLAEESGDEELLAVADELEGLVAQLEAGTISEEELLDRLDQLDARIASIEEPPEERIDLDPLWESIADDAEEAVAALGLPEDSPLQEQAEELLEAIEEGDEEAIADAVEALDDMLEALQDEDLDPEDLSALADLLEQFSDLIDPTDPALQELWEQYRDEIGEYESRLAERERSRDRRGLERAQEGLAETEQQMADAEANRDRSEQTQANISDALNQAAEELRQRASGEPPNPDPENRGETPTGEGQDDAEGRSADEREARDGEVPDEERGSSTAGEASDGENPPTDSGEQSGPSEQQEPGEQSEPGEQGTRPEGEPNQGEAPDQPDSPPDNGEGGEGNMQADGDQAGSGTTSAGSGESEEERPLDRAADALRQQNRESAQDEGRDRAERASQDLRENLQRSSGREPNDAGASEWQDFVERAGGEEMAGETGGDESDPTLHSSEGTDSTGQPTPEQAVGGEGDGGDPLGDEATEAGGTREAAGEAGLAQGDDGPANPAEVFETAATSGFATRAYQDIYVEYERAAEAALEAEEIPRGYARFVRRYLEMIEPRVRE